MLKVAIQPGDFVPLNQLLIRFQPAHRLNTAGYTRASCQKQNV